MARCVLVKFQLQTKLQSSPWDGKSLKSRLFYRAVLALPTLDV
jgi:hypothetical protein